MGPESATPTCEACTKAYSKYACPRCAARVCSLGCYNTHNRGRCRDVFHGEGLRDAMRGVVVDDDGKRAMIEALKRRGYADGVYDFASGGDEDEGDAEVEDEDAARCVLSETSLEALSRGEMLDVDALDARELASFRAACARGELVVPWTPWWMEKEAGETRVGASGARVVEEISENVREDLGKGETSATETSSSVPLPATAAEALEPFEVLSRGKTPPESLRWHCVNALAAYVLVKRIFNGDWTDDEATAASLLLDISSVLGARTAIGGIECATSATHDVVERAARLAPARALLPPPSALPRALSTELSVIFSRGINVIILAFLDLSRVLNSASMSSSGASKPARAAFRAARLKSRYLAAYSISTAARDPRALDAVARALRVTSSSPEHTPE